MKASERKEINQSFELDNSEVTDCFATYLKNKGMNIPEKAQFSFRVDVGPTDREIKAVKITAKYVEDGVVGNGNTP